jgi:hypothetical protein
MEHHYDAREFDLQTFEYAWIRVDVHSTLVQEFQAQSLVGNAGTFPLDTADALDRCFTLVDQFLEEFGMSVNPSAGGDSLPGENCENPRGSHCPLFTPRHHLCLVSSVFTVGEGVCITVYPVRSRTSMTTNHPFDAIKNSTLVPILPPSSDLLLSGYCTTEPLPCNDELLQDQYAMCMFVVGSTVGDSSHSIFLDDTSVRHFLHALPRVSDEINQAIADASSPCRPDRGSRPCGCLPTLHGDDFLQTPMSYSVLSDIIVGLSHSTVRSPPLGSAGSLNLHQESRRLLIVAERFVAWLRDRR